MNSGEAVVAVTKKQDKSVGTIELFVEGSREMSQLRAPIKSKKHIVQVSQTTVAQSAVLVTNLVVGVEATSTIPANVEEGAIVKAVFVELWLGNASTSVVGSYACILVKNVAGGSIPDSTDMSALHDYPNKKNILFTSQAILPPTDGGQIAIMRGFYKIPKGKQRFGLNDKLQLVVMNRNLTAVDINLCGFALYKEYT